MIRRVLNRSLASRLAGATGVIAAVVVLAVSVVTYRSAVSALHRRLLDRLSTQVEASERSAREWLDRQRAALEHLATLESQRLEMAHRGDDRLRALPPQLLSATTTLLLEVPGGRVLAASDTSLIGQYEADQQFYREGRNATFVQPIYPSARTGLPTVSIATPVRVGRQTRAVLVAHLDLAELERTLAIPQSTIRTDAYFVNRLAEFVSPSRFGIAGHERGVHSVGIDSALQGVTGAGVYDDYRGERVVGAWRWIGPLDMALMLEADHGVAIAPARRLLLLNTATGLLALGVILAGTVTAVRRFTGPVIRVADATTAVARGDLSVRVPVAGTDEVRRLSEAFNVMTDRLAGAYTDLENQVSATRVALQEADANRALLQGVVDSGTTLVLVLRAGEVLLANARLRRIIGVTAEQPLTLDALRRSPAAALLGVIDDAGRGPAIVERELTLAVEDGSHDWQVVAFPITAAGSGSGITGLIATDLTERARAEADRRAQDAEHQQAQKLESLGIMAGGIAHDFNNLLGAILGNVELAQMSDDDPAQRRASLEQISAASRRAAELTRQMLAYAGRASLRREIIDVKAVINDLLPLVRAAQSKKVEFAVECPDDALHVEADPAQVSQVLLNLLTNAAEAIGARPGVVTVQGERVGRDGRPDARGRFVRISVQDTGDGIPDEVRERIFDPFFSTKDSGRGLGLSAVRGIVQSLGGQLEVQSAPGQGSRFDVLLPVAIGPQESPSATAARLQVPISGTALIVDDEAALRRVARVLLEKMGMQVLEAEDGIAGLDRFRTAREQLSLVVLDLTMPGLGGGEVLREIRRVSPTLPVIIASGYDHADAATHFQQDAYLRFLQKPFNLSALREAVAASLA